MQLDIRYIKMSFGIYGDIKDQIVSCFQGYVRSDVKFFVVLSSVLTLLVSHY